MTKRERILASAVGGLILIIAAVYLISTVSDAFDQRENKLIDLEGLLARQEREVLFGDAARRKFDTLLEKSLPSDPAFAQSIYQNWLLDLADETVELEQVSVNSMKGTARGDVYFEHRFSVTGEGSLEQLIEFMYEFYHANYLHRIGRVSAQPITGSSRLNLSISVECLSLNEAPENKPLSGERVSRLARRELDAYLEMIARRNPFAPANKTPRFAPLATQQGNPGRPVSFAARATDPDGHEITYSLAGSPPADARIDPKTGMFRWTPAETGEYEVVIRAADEALPSLGDELKVAIVVADPPAVEKSPEFDVATLARVTGITGTDDRREVWVLVPTENRLLKLREGDQLAIGTIEGVIAGIDPAAAKIRTDDGKLITVGLGKHLVDPAMPDL